MSDAAACAGGAAVYAGRKLKNGLWTCRLLASRSKLMSATIPRNELSAIMMMAELAFVVKKSLGSRVERIIYLTDSTIAMCWMHNINIKLRAFTFARVEASRRLIQMTTGAEEIPLFHIEGSTNLADLLTKHHELTIEDLSTDSSWQKGHSWMNLNEDQMNLTKYEDLKLDKKSSSEISTECFAEPFIPDSDQGKYGSHSIQLDHLISECLDDDPDPQFGDPQHAQPYQEHNNVYSSYCLESINNPPPLST